MRKVLVGALASCADTPSRANARRFLRGLSSDELQFIAEFLGACILEEGRIVEQGIHNDLLARSPRYRELYELTFSENEDQEVSLGV